MLTIKSCEGLGYLTLETEDSKQGKACTAELPFAQRKAVNQETEAHVLCVLSALMCVHHVNTWCLQKPEEGVRSPVTGEDPP